MCKFNKKIVYNFDKGTVTTFVSYTGKFNEYIILDFINIQTTKIIIYLKKD